MKQAFCTGLNATHEPAAGLDENGMSMADLARRPRFLMETELLETSSDIAEREGLAAAAYVGAHSSTEMAGRVYVSPQANSAEAALRACVRAKIASNRARDMTLNDGLLSRTHYESGLADPVLGAFDADANVFATVMHGPLSELPALSGSAEQGDAITIAPGVFAPSCRNHDTIHENTEVFGVSIAPDPAMPDVSYYFFDVFDAWRSVAAHRPRC